MNTEKRPFTNLAGLITAHREMLTPRCTHRLRQLCLPTGWYLTVNQLLTDHEQLLNCDGHGPTLTLAAINAEMGTLQFLLWPNWDDDLPDQTPLLNNTRQRRYLDKVEVERIERLFATAPERLTRMHLKRASSALVKKAEADALHICEECGAPGERRRKLNIPRVLCPHHYVIALSATARIRDEGNAVDWDSWELLFGDIDAEDFAEPAGHRPPVKIPQQEDGKSAAEDDQNRDG